MTSYPNSLLNSIAVICLDRGSFIQNIEAADLYIQSNGVWAAVSMRVIWERGCRNSKWIPDRLGTSMASWILFNSKKRHLRPVVLSWWTNDAASCDIPQVPLEVCRCSQGRTSWYIHRSRDEPKIGSFKNGSDIGSLFPLRSCSPHDCRLSLVAIPAPTHCIIQSPYIWNSIDIKSHSVTSKTMAWRWYRRLPNCEVQYLSRWTHVFAQTALHRQGNNETVPHRLGLFFPDSDEFKIHPR